MMLKVLIFVIALVAFALVSPGVDQYIAALPYNPAATKFYGEVHTWCTVVYYSVPLITTLVIIYSLWLWFKSKARDSKKTAAIILCALILGPGIVINAVFKDHWGRPRPYQVLRDGKTFSPVWQYNFHQPKDNSFPGGHASIGYFIGVLFLANRRRRAALLAGIAGGGFIGLVRILQGGHYFSDIIFSGIFVWLTAELVCFTINRITGSSSG